MSNLKIYTNILIRYDYSAHKNNFGIQIFPSFLTRNFSDAYFHPSSFDIVIFFLSFYMRRKFSSRHTLMSSPFLHILLLSVYKSNNILCFLFIFFLLHASKKEKIEVKLTIYDKDEEEIAKGAVPQP